MNRTIKQIVGLLPALWLLAACQDDTLSGGLRPGDGVLRLSGVNAQQVQIDTRADEVKGFFPLDTHYRILMEGDADGNGTGQAPELRFSDVGRDILSGSQHFIRLLKCQDDLVFREEEEVVNFYGLTDPAIQMAEGSTGYQEFVNSYLPVGEDFLYRLEAFEEEGKYTLPDLRSAVSTGNSLAELSYVVPLQFKHILSKVNFEIVQQVGEGGEGELFDDLTLEGLTVPGQPTAGTFYLKEDRFTALTGEAPYPVSLTGDNLPIPITTAPKRVGSILLFPMAAENPNGEKLLKVEITLGGEMETLKLFNKSGENIQDKENGQGSLTLTCPVYTNNPAGGGDGTTPLRLLPNYEYDLQFVIMSNEVRIITIVPRVYEWLDGETDNHSEEDGYYEEQDLGQPVTFGGVVWSDRNLGANSGHPLYGKGEWRKSIGYFYQFNRNIPYFPNTYIFRNDVNLNTPLEEAFQEDASQGAPNYLGYRTLYPVVNYRAWDLSYVRPNEDWYPPKADEAIKPVDGKLHDSFVHTIGEKVSPTVWEDKKYLIRFGINKSWNGKQGKDENGKPLPIVFPGKKGLWIKEDGTKGEQPCPEGWSIPTEEQFRGIMPTSGYAGNIAFRNYVAAKKDGGWEATQDKNSQFKEHDFPEMFKKGGEGLIYRNIGAGEPMTDEEGNSKAYLGTFPCLFREEKNDPQDGAKSQYVLSMHDGDWTRVQDASGNLDEGDKNENYVYNWGVIYGIKNQGTSKAYRLKWEVKVVGDATPVSDLSAAKQFCDDPNTKMYDGKTALRYDNLYCYLVISRYSATAADDLSPDENGSCEWVAADKEWWSRPAEVLYLPIGGVAGEFRAGKLYNIGTEVRYALVDESDKELTVDGKKYYDAYNRCVWLKIAGGSISGLGLFFADSYKSDLITIRPVRDN